MNKINSFRVNKLIIIICTGFFLMNCNSLTYVERKNARAENDLIRWAKKNAVPFSMDKEGKDELFSAIGDAVGDAQIVAVSEAAHNTREFISTNAAVIEYLIQKKVLIP